MNLNEILDKHFPLDQDEREGELPEEEDADDPQFAGARRFLRTADPTRLFVCDRLCDTCIYSARSPLRHGVRQQHVEKCVEDRAPAVCHHASMRGLTTVCRGFYNQYGQALLVFVLGKSLGKLFVLDPDASELPEPGKEEPLR